MTRPSWSLAMSAVAVCTMTTAAQQAPVFRARTDLVSVTVVVRDGRRAVPDLQAPDFVLTDNGVRQEIDEVVSVDVPVDVSLLVDVSASTAGDQERFREDVSRIARTLAPDDRLRLLAFGTRVVETAPPGPTHELLLLPMVDQAGATSLHDALADALMRRVPSERRHLVIIFTDGRDTFSVVSAETVRQIARRSDAVLYLALTSPSREARPLARRWPILAHVDWSAESTLIEAAESTGGRRMLPGLFSRSIAGPFRDALEEFRSSYVLRYRPRNVTTSGWHDLRVEVPARRNVTVRARRGYVMR
jgi:VWFA-related protein